MNTTEIITVQDYKRTKYECEWNYRESHLRNFSCSQEHLDWLEIDLNATEIITVQDYKRTKYECEWKYTYTALKLRVEQAACKLKIY